MVFADDENLGKPASKRSKRGNDCSGKGGREQPSREVAEERQTVKLRVRKGKK